MPMPPYIRKACNCPNAAFVSLFRVADCDPRVFLYLETLTQEAFYMSAPSLHRESLIGLVDNIRVIACSVIYIEASKSKTLRI